MSKQGQAPILTKKEQKLVLDNLSGTKFETRDKAIFLLAFRAGLRATEIASISLADFVNEEKPISSWSTINSAKPTKKDKYEVEDIKRTITLRKEITKGSKVEKAHLVDKELRQALTDYLNNRYERHFNKDVKEMFITNKFCAFDANGMAHLFLAMSKKTGVKFTSHSGRRTLCTSLANKGVNAFELQHIMRHKDISTTMLYYQQDESRLASVMEDNL